MSATPKGCDSRWYTVVVGVRLTDGLKGTIVQRPSSPVIKTLSTYRPIFILCGEALIFALHGWLTGALVEEAIENIHKKWLSIVN